MTEKQILEKYKRFFNNKENLVKEYGLQCEVGWYPLIAEMLEKISATKPCKLFKILQIKEKFGLLRVYTNNGDCAGTQGPCDPEKIQTIIDGYIQVSSSTCEWCGTTKKVKIRNRESWIKTLCDKDYQSWKTYERMEWYDKK